MKDRLFGKTFKYTFGLLVIFDILSYLFFGIDWLNWLAVTILALGVLFLSLKRPELALTVLAAELFVGSKGYLFAIGLSGFSLSVRIVLFAAFMLGWLIRLIVKKQGTEFFSSRWFKPYLLLLIFLLIGAVNGLLNNSLKTVFFDLNGWFYFLAAPAFYTALIRRGSIDRILSVLLAATLFLSFKTLVSFFFFSYQLTAFGGGFYKWLRDSGVGEITLVGDSFWRIFFQSQIYVVIAMIISLVLFWLSAEKYKEKLSLAGLIAVYWLAIFISLSRSFWLGLAAAVFLLVLFLLFKYKLSFWKIIKTGLFFIILFILEVILLFLLSGNFGNWNMASRLNTNTAEPAASSRLNQLEPLGQAINRSPFIGSGFGTEVTYISNDPRIKSQSSDGLYSTYAFEWGYLDIWLKIGLIGLLVYLWFMLKIFISGLSGNTLSLALALSLVAVVVISIFSPYLNHPLGIGFLLLTLPLLTYRYESRT